MQYPTLATSEGKKKRKPYRLAKTFPLYFMVLPAAVYILIFAYVPMYGILLAFQNYLPGQDIFDASWVGMAHFKRLFALPQFREILFNTLRISLYQLVAGFPLPILLALLLNHCDNRHFQKSVQAVTYASHFISVVILVGMLNILLNPRVGIVNLIITALGGSAVDFMGSQELFPHVYVWSSVWQNTGWGSIVYIAALSGVDLSQYEAATIDGANKLQKIRYIDIPAILPCIATMFILNCGSIMSIGFEKAFLMQNSLNIGTSEIISTYVYKVGLLNYQYSFSTAVGLFNNVINILLVAVANFISKKTANVSIV